VFVTCVVTPSHALIATENSNTTAEQSR